MIRRKLHLRRLTLRKLDPERANQVRGQVDLDTKTADQGLCVTYLMMSCVGSCLFDGGCPKPGTIPEPEDTCNISNCVSCPPDDPTIADTYCPCQA
jgi:hypothetical protein